MAEEEAPATPYEASYITTLISTPGGGSSRDTDSDDEFINVPTPHSTSSSSADSSLGTSISSASTSLKSYVQAYPWENGRRYHAYRAGSYLLPNDEPEQDRMDLAHCVWRLVLGGQLVSAAVKEGLGIRSGGLRVLDLGTGTGIWTMDFADEWIDRGVVLVGNDLSPIQPRWVPPNCAFVVDDFESPWSYRTSEAFDLIHARSLAGSVASWPSLVSSMHAHLQPGGWVELQECEVEVYSRDDEALDQVPMVRDWVRLLETGGALFGKRFDVVDDLEALLLDGGFVDVHRDVYEVQIGQWPFEESLNGLGLLLRASVVAMVEPYTTALLTRVLRWSLEDTKGLIEEVQSELKKADLRLYCKFHTVYGRKER